MTQQEENIRSMLYALIKVVEPKLLYIAGVPVFEEDYDAVKDILNEINTQRILQLVPSTGVTIDKANAQRALVNDCAIMAGNVKDYWLKQNNNTNAKEVDYSASDINNSDDTEVADICGVIISKADALLTAQPVAFGTKYAVTAARITALNAKLTTFTGLLGGPDAAIATRATATGNISELTQKVMVKIGSMKTTVLNFDDPDFISTVLNAMQIIDRGGAQHAHVGNLLLNIKDSLGNPIVGATAVVVEPARTEISNDMGKSLFNDLPVGTVSYKVTAPGKKPYTATADINDGLTTEVEVVMEDE